MSEYRTTGCTFDVKAHPAATRRPDGGFVDGAIGIGGQFVVERDLQPGDELTVTIASADARAQGKAAVMTDAALLFRVVVGLPPVGLNGASSAGVSDSLSAAALCATEALFARPPRELPPSARGGLLPGEAAAVPRPARTAQRHVAAAAGSLSDRQRCRSRPARHLHRRTA